MPTLPARHAAALALAALLSAGHAMAADSLFTLNGSTDSGPLAGTTFVGSFAYDASAAVAGFNGDIALSAFTLQFAGQTYSLASADSLPVAAFANGQFLGLAYVDADAADTGARPAVALVPGFTGFAGDAYMSYVGAAGEPGFGDYSISAVPEPASTLLMLAGLGGLCVAARRRRHHPGRVAA
jgi:hypothetical protein